MLAGTDAEVLFMLPPCRAGVYHFGAAANFNVAVLQRAAACTWHRVPCFDASVDYDVVLAKHCSLSSTITWCVDTPCIAALCKSIPAARASLVLHRRCSTPFGETAATAGQSGRMYVSFFTS